MASAVSNTNPLAQLNELSVAMGQAIAPGCYIGREDEMTRNREESLSCAELARRVIAAAVAARAGNAIVNVFKTRFFQFIVETYVTRYIVRTSLVGGSILQSDPLRQINGAFASFVRPVTEKTGIPQDSIQQRRDRLLALPPAQLGADDAHFLHSLLNYRALERTFFTLLRDFSVMSRERAMHWGRANDLGFSVTPDGSGVWLGELPALANLFSSMPRWMALRLKCARYFTVMDLGADTPGVRSFIVSMLRARQRSQPDTLRCFEVLWTYLCIGESLRAFGRANCELNRLLGFVTLSSGIDWQANFVAVAAYFPLLSAYMENAIHFMANDCGSRDAMKEAVDEEVGKLEPQEDHTRNEELARAAPEVQRAFKTWREQVMVYSDRIQGFIEQHQQQHAAFHCEYQAIFTHLRTYMKAVSPSRSTRLALTNYLPGCAPEGIQQPLPTPEAFLRLPPQRELTIIHARHEIEAGLAHCPPTPRAAAQEAPCAAADDDEEISDITESFEDMIVNGSPGTAQPAVAVGPRREQRKFLYARRVRRWVDPQCNPFADNDYREQQLPPQRQQELRLYHGFGVAMDELILLHGLSSTFESPTTRKRNRSYSLPGEIECNGRTVRGIFTICFDDGTIYHRYFSPRAYAQFIQEYAAQAFNRIDVQGVGAGGDGAVGQPPAAVMDDDSHIVSKTESVITVADPRNQATLRAYL